MASQKKENHNLQFVKDPVETVLVEYTRFQSVYQSLQECYESYRTCAEPPCLAITGPSGAGKSTIGMHFRDKHPEVSHDWGTEIPVLWVRVPTQLTIRSFAEEMLSALGDPYPSRGSAVTLGRRIDRAIGLWEGSHRCRIVCLNELQHFVDSRWGIPYEVANFLKDRIEESGVSFVTFGLTYGLEVIEQNEQLQRFFQESIEINPFKWEEESDRKVFRGFLKALRTSLADAYTFPQMEDVDLAFRLHYASFGLIGYLMKIIRGAAKIARKRGSNHVTEAMLAESYRRNVRGQEPLNHDPFKEKAFTFETAPALVQPEERAANRRAKSARRKAPHLSARRGATRLG